MKKEKKDDSFIKKPYFEGGEKALGEFIKKNLKYPKIAFEQKTQGMVLVRCEIDFKGTVTDVKVLKSVGQGCDEEAVRVAKLIKFQVPKSPKGLKVTFHKDLRFPFKIITQKPQAATPQLSLNYNIVANKPKEQNEEQNKKMISYTITI